MRSSDALLGCLAVSTGICALKAWLFLPDFLWVLRHGPAIRRHLLHADSPADAMALVEEEGLVECRVCGPSTVPARPRWSRTAAGGGGQSWFFRTPVLVLVEYVLVVCYVLATGSGNAGNSPLEGMARVICSAAGVTLAALSLLTLAAAPVLRYALGGYDLHHSDLRVLVRDAASGRDAPLAFALYFLGLIGVSLVGFAGLYEALYASTRAFDATVVVSPVTWFYLSAVTASTVGFGDVQPADAGGQIAITTQILGGPLVLFWLFGLLAGTRPTVDEEASGTAPLDRATRDGWDLTIILPAFNEFATLSATLAQLTLSSWTQSGRAQVVIVNDGSTDGSALTDWAGLAPGLAVEVINLPRRGGKWAAVRHGLRLARGKFVLITDADLPIPPHEIERCLELARGREVAMGGCVVGRRTRGRAHGPEASLSRRCTSFLVRKSLGRMSGGEISDPACPLKIFLAEGASSVIVSALQADGYLADWELTAALRAASVPIVEEPVNWHDQRGPTREKLRRYGPGRVLHDVRALRSLMT